MATEGAAEAIPVLRSFVLNPKAKRGERIAAGRELLKYGLGTQKEVSVDEVKERLRKTINVLRELLTPEQFADVTSRLHTIWR